VARACAICSSCARNALSFAFKFSKLPSTASIPRVVNQGGSLCGLSITSGDQGAIISYDTLTF
jgi:hypothetical protein